MFIIPAIDLLDGKVVRLEKGDYDKVTVYNDSAVDEARKFQEAGFGRIHVVDLNGARDGTFQNIGLVRDIIQDLDLSVQLGGGIRSSEDAEMLLDSGVSRIICGSLAVKEPETWLKLIETYPERTILGMDLKDGRIAYDGWTDTSEQSITDFLEPMVHSGLNEVLCTDVSRDGMLTGPNLSLYKKLMKEHPSLKFIASGGISGKQDLVDLDEVDLHAVVVGRAYYENKLTLEEMMQI